jgi:glycosyltransferase involved in cell wall biosynthesis
MGCPVIVSDQGALMEVSGDGALVFKMGEIEDLCSKLMEITENDALRNALINNGRIQLKKFDRDTYFEAMEAYFSRVVENTL